MLRLMGGIETLVKDDEDENENEIRKSEINFAVPAISQLQPDASLVEECKKPGILPTMLSILAKTSKSKPVFSRS